VGVLGGVKAKLDRADALIAELRARVEPIAAAATESIQREEDGDATKVLFRITHLPAIETDIAALVGDVVHNLRSALDHLAWQLVLFDGGQPNGSTSFPILIQPAVVTINPAIKNQEILDALIEAQPFSSAAHGHDPRDDNWNLSGC
jgi:hypothetical protein